MTGSDAILVGEGWISEHYFTTDATTKSFRARVNDRRKLWDAEAKEDRKTPRSRFTEARQAMEVAFAGLDELSEADQRDAVEKVYEQLLDVLDIQGLGRKIERIGPLLKVTSPGIPGRAPLVVVLARPAATVEDALVKDEPTLLEPVALEQGGEEFTSVSRVVSALFRTDDAPNVALILAGRWSVLAEQERWAEGRYLAVDLQLVCERNDTKRGGEIDRALTCLSGESIAPDADGTLWWTEVFAESINHTVGVSKDLRDGVRLSIEIIGNDVVTRRATQGLPPLPVAVANELAKQALRFLYRILFLLYAEASPELGVLPVGAREYDEGYSLDRLRELVQVELANPRAQRGTHLYQSLGVLFRLVNTGHEPCARDDESTADEGLRFNALRADLFEPRATAFIDDAGLSNSALQKVLAHLLLSKEKRGKDRGFISYAELGINQLGAVYEGLMSYTGFFADTDLYEVAKGGDASKGSWMVPFERAEGIAASDFVKAENEITGERKPVVHLRGSFVFRLSGRERQQSASYYTPEVLTRFTVGQALDELLDQDGQTTEAAEILELTVCEPALGSGAFAIEAVRQLADQYLKRRQNELKIKIDPDEYPRRLQEVKAYLALHNVYGVDLNSTAVELAEISLWLDTMVAGLSAPWFGLHLRRGNSLIGARRAVYTRKQVADKSWLTAVPRDVPLGPLTSDLGDGRLGEQIDGGVFHFLLPAQGWGASREVYEAKELKAVFPERRAYLKTWSGRCSSALTSKQVNALSDLSLRVEKLWQISMRRLAIAEIEIRRSIPVWGADRLPSGRSVQRPQIEQYLNDGSGAYRRLRRVMDAWCALWYWPVGGAALDAIERVHGENIRPPSVDDWIDALRMLLGAHTGKKAPPDGQETLGSLTSWEELDLYEGVDRWMASALPVDSALRAHPWLRVCELVAAREAFFHWELEFAPATGRGGFDLQLGNPPWVRPRTDLAGLLAESDPWWELADRPSIEEKSSKLAEATEIVSAIAIAVDGVSTVSASLAFLGSAQNYPDLEGLQPDLYRCFMISTWRHASRAGVVGLIHPETHFTDERARVLRSASYARLRRHWQFANELQLFEIDHHVSYGVHIYAGQRGDPGFMMATSLYHPDTVERSLLHDGVGSEPGLKDVHGSWDLHPHRSRITPVTHETLLTWHAVLETSKVPVGQTRMVYAVNRAAVAVLDKLSRSRRIGELGLRFSEGWHESRDRRDGLLIASWGRPSSWDDVILQGPHLFVATPLYKAPNESMRNNLDWSATDFEALGTDAIPVTAYKPAGDGYRYDCAYTDWGDEDNPDPARDHYRIAWRRMAANTGERTLIPALIPPGAAHVHPVYSMGLPNRDPALLVTLCGYVSSMVLDFMVRTVPKSEILFGTINRLPINYENGLVENLNLRVLRLNCVTSAYSDLWSECYSPEFVSDSRVGGLEHAGRPEFGQVGPKWTPETPLRVASDRRQALIEIDAIVALVLGLAADELCTIYRTQFAVLYGYDRNTYFYDANGRLVPSSVLTVWRKKGDRISEEERTATNQAGNTYTYELPFVTLDREKDMRQAYEHFERLLKERQ